jgi:polyisoprenoid-binding protein YceI
MSTTTTGTRTYVIDPAHSSAHFSVRHLMISKVRGAFKKISGTVNLPESGPIPSAISVEIDAASIDTGEEQRDGHLKSADFFEVEKFPNLTFTSTSITPSGSESFDVAGDLEIHGVKQPVTITVNVAGQGKDPWGNDRIAYEASFKINRKDHGLVWNQALEAGGVAIGEHVDITLDVETVPKPA